MTPPGRQPRTENGPATVWITGARGLIGSHLAAIAPRFVPGSRVIPLARTDLELTDSPALRERFAREQPALVLHCAAVTKSLVCEQNPALARAVNVEVPRQLAELTQNGRLVFFSTDLVFDGLKGNYRETDAPSPINVYGESKAQAERFVLKFPNHIVIRTSLNGGPSPTGDRSFGEDTQNAWRAGKTLKFFTDEFRNPIHAELTARAAWELALSPAPGLFHVAGREKLSRWEIGQLLAGRYAELHPRLEPGSLRSFQGPPRSPDTSLNCERAQSALSFPLLGMREWMRQNPSRPF